ncbi:MAG: restriction endonuclease subunit S [Pseudomonadota bacterium]|nr:restriction endonuclease subunit S [Pseudomonadota bacterium]
MSQIALSEWVQDLESGARPKGGIRDGIGDIPSLGAEHLSDDGGFNFTKDKRIPRAFFLQMNKGRVRKNDILVVKDGATTGKVSFVDEGFPYEEAAINEHVFRISVCTKKADPGFVFRFLQSPAGQAQIMSDFRGATVGGIGRTFVDKVQLPRIELDAQRRIAAILDKADAIRRKRQQALALADDFLKSVFLDMFGDPASNPKNWPIHSLGDLGDVQGGLQVTKRRDELELRRPYLRVANVYRDRLALDEIKEIGLTESEFKRVALLKGDVLIVEGHGNPDEIGRCAVWNGSVHDCVHQNHLIRFRPDPTALLSEFVSHLLNSEGGRIQLISAGRTTSGLNTISTRKVKEVQLPLPPITLQQDYLKIVRRYQSHFSMLAATAEEGSKLFASLSQRAFRGEL